MTVILVLTGTCSHSYAVKYTVSSLDVFTMSQRKSTFVCLNNNFENYESDVTIVCLLQYSCQHRNLDIHTQTPTTGRQYLNSPFENCSMSPSPYNDQAITDYTRIAEYCN